VTLREQFRQVFSMLWRVLRPNPLRAHGLLYYGLVGRFTRDEEMRHRIDGWLAEANPSRRGSS
jgi:hypothetical protein